MSSPARVERRARPAAWPLRLATAVALVVGAGCGDEPEVEADAADDALLGSPEAVRVELGRLLFFDKVLSGNRNIACATCHHPSLGTGDGLALPLGEGATGLGRERRAPVGPDRLHARVARNSQPLFNLGEPEFTRLFHDGRVEVDAAGHYASGFVTPARWKLPTGLDSVLAAQAMFPVTAPDEMAGQRGENPIADAVALDRLAGPAGAWELLARRLRAIPVYARMFRRAFEGEVRDADDIGFVHAANAIAAFERSAFRSQGSPYDALLADPRVTLSAPATRGMALFRGRAGCSTCHAGRFQTDHAFHAIGMPQLGPGKGDGRDGSYWRASGLRAFVEDFGRGRVTGRPEDAFRFRTPSLRNVALTGPWGHDGAYATLEAVVRHHLDPVAALERYDLRVARLPPLPEVGELRGEGDRVAAQRLSAHEHERFVWRDAWVQRSAGLRDRIALASELSPQALTDREVDDLVAFLHALTDPSAPRLDALVPDAVPSGLPVDAAPRPAYAQADTRARRREVPRALRCGEPAPADVDRGAPR